MATLSVSASGSLQVIDTSNGSLVIAKTILATFPTCSVFSAADSFSIGTSPTTISLPASSAQVVFIHNLDATNTLAVTWTPVEASPVPVNFITLQPGAMILLVESNTTSGISALSLQASVALLVDYVLAG